MSTRKEAQLWRDEETVRWAYHEKELSQRDVASLLGASTDTIQRWMKKHEIDRRLGPNRAGPWRDEQTLHAEYVEKQNSMRELAERWDTSTATISNWLERHGIEHRHSHPEAEDHPQYIDGRSPGVGDTEGLDLPERECVRCGEMYKPSDHRQEYCGKGCWGEAMKKRVPLECEVCGSVFEVPECNASRRVCCSYDCLSIFQSGENSPRWKGGHSSYYGPSWRKQRQKARERDDGECQVCGRSDDVHVHHIRPFRKFGVEKHEEANQLDNLVCLCPEHHVQWEGIPLRPDTGDLATD